jgi:serine/threonine protein phosphatase PrpC
VTGHAVAQTSAMDSLTAPLAVDYAGLSVVGCVREHNEDRLGWAALDAGEQFVAPAAEFALAEAASSSERGLIFAVADGLGGYGGGDVASGLAVEACLDGARSSLSGGGRASGALRSAFYRANQAIFDAALGGRGGRRMQSTLSALVMTPGEAHLGHVGDSRIYRRHGGELEILTADHSQVMDMLRMRLITPEQAVDHPARYALTRSVGGDITVRVDIRTEQLESGDVFLLCSDGLWSNVTSSEIADALHRSPEEACRRLVDLALERGGDDNATAMAVRVCEAGQRPEAPQGWRRLFS